MLRIKFNSEILKYMSLFESLTRTKLKDCFFDSKDLLVFVVNENELGKAIGKNGDNIRRISTAFRKRVKLVEYSPHLIKFVSNLLYPLKPTEITEEGGVITVTGADTKTKGLLIGRSGQNLRNNEEIVKRYFEISEIKVV
ncbi:MAG: NusA-like transcription termination signal-binding factor [archaeon]